MKVSRNAVVNFVRITHPGDGIVPPAMLAGQITQRRQIELIGHPEPAIPGEIVFQPELACLSGSDIPYFAAEHPEYPLKVGLSLHEMVGTVLWSDGTRFQAGQKVLAVPTNHVGIFERFAISEKLVVPLDLRRPLEEMIVSQPLGTVLYVLGMLPNLLGWNVVVLGRRRVKEQLKKMGSFEFFQTSFSYIDKESGEERYVGVPEEGGENVISSDPLEPGSVYAASVDDQGKAGIYRLEVGCCGGTGKLKLAGGIEGPMKESIQHAFGYLQSNKVRLGIAHDFDNTDFHVEAIGLLQNQVSCECGVALIVALISAIKRSPVQAALVILGDISIQGNIKGVRTLVEPSQLAMENGARRVLIPIENRRQFLEVSGDLAERLDPIFYGDAPVAANKALGMS